MCVGQNLEREREVAQKAELWRKLDPDTSLDSLGSDPDAEPLQISDAVQMKVFDILDVRSDGVIRPFNVLLGIATALFATRCVLGWRGFRRSLPVGGSVHL